MDDVSIRAFSSSTSLQSVVGREVPTVGIATPV
jgi:hypothetical protein